MALTNWFVLTGGPNAGKTKTLEKLTSVSFSHKPRFRTVPETARLVIDELLSQKMPMEEIRKDPRWLQAQITELQLKLEAEIYYREPTVFDRGRYDTIAYCKESGIEVPKGLPIMQNFYRGVFFLESLPYTPDYARTEDDLTARKLSESIKEVYLDIGYDVLTIPVKPISERVNMILGIIRDSL